MLSESDSGNNRIDLVTDVPYRPSAALRRVVFFLPVASSPIVVRSAMASETPFFSTALYVLAIYTFFMGYVVQFEFQDAFVRRRGFPWRWQQYPYAAIVRVAVQVDSLRIYFRDGRSWWVPEYLANQGRVKQIIARRVGPDVFPPPRPRGPWNLRRPSDRWRRFRRWLYS